MSLSARRGYRGISVPQIAPLKGAVRRTGWSVILAASKSPCMTLREFAQDEPPHWLLDVVEGRMGDWWGRWTTTTEVYSINAI